jgi:hypothetical protein
MSATGNINSFLLFLQQRVDNSATIEYINNLLKKKDETNAPVIEKSNAIEKLKVLDSLLSHEGEDKKMAALSPGALDTYLTSHFENIGTKIARKTSQENSTDLDFLSKEYDDISRSLEKINNAVIVLGVMTSPLAFVGLAPLTGGLLVLNALIRVSTTGFAQYEKYKELNYISSACLGFTTALMKNTAEMVTFYSILDDIKQRNKTTAFIDPQHLVELNNINKSATWNVIQENLWKFLIFLITQIEFSIDSLGEKQYIFWKLFLETVTFSRNESVSRTITVDTVQTQIPYSFKYTHNYCSRPEHKNSPICNNFNDELMRVLEEKIKFLLEHIRRKYQESNLAVRLTKGVLNASGARSQQQPKQNDNAKIKEGIKLFKNDILKKFEKYNKSSSYGFINGAIESFCLTLTRFADELYTEQEDLHSTIKVSVKEQSPTTVTPTPRRVGGSKFRKTKKEKSLNRRTKKIHNVINVKLRQSGGRFFADWLRSLTATQVYRELLREYTIMTANVAVVTTDYVLHYNKCILLLGLDVYKEAYKTQLEKNEKIKQLKSELDELAKDTANEDGETDSLAGTVNSSVSTRASSESITESLREGPTVPP